MKSAHVLGWGVVTPVGCSTGQLLHAVRSGSRPPPEFLSGICPGRKFPVLRVPMETCAGAADFPRLRRAGRISHFALQAALHAFKHAGIGLEEIPSLRIALVFAASDGSVGHTRKFFEGIVAAGAGAGSPLVFPETVYNAPPSHLSASLGLSGHSLALVGDSSTALRACETASLLLESGECDIALALAAEEWDPSVSEGYAAWGLTSPDEQGAIFSEGAAALLLSRDRGDLQISVDIPPSLGNPAALEFAVEQENLRLPFSPRSLLLTSSTRHPHRYPLPRFLSRRFPDSPLLNPRTTLGEALCASTLLEVCLGLEAIRSHDATDALCAIAGWRGMGAIARLRRIPRIHPGNSSTGSSSQ